MARWQFGGFMMAGCLLAAFCATAGAGVSIGDLNVDGTVNIIDLNMVLIDWDKSGAEISDSRADADDNGTINIIDLNHVLIHWGEIADFTLTVTSGSGGGTYTAGEIAPISANAPASGYFFNGWTGDIATLADPNATETTITMPVADAAITAAFSEFTYQLTVNNGSGDGAYPVATVVGIATASPEGQAFDVWVGDTTGIADVNSASTTITIQPVAATITATYLQLPTHTLTVISGSGGGNYVQGTAVGISADPAPSGKAFHQWLGDTGGIPNVFHGMTTLTMPAGDATITATYQNGIAVTGPGVLTVDGGYYVLTQDISAPGTAITINAENVTLDLNRNRITYNTSSGSGPYYGVYVPLGSGGGDGYKITNGYIVQGAGASTGGAAVYVGGASWMFDPKEISYLVTYTHSYLSSGITAPLGYGFYNGEVHHCYVLCDGGTNPSNGSGGTSIAMTANPYGNTTPSSVSIHDNIVVGPHRGPSLGYAGWMIDNPQKSYMYNNLIQHKRKLDGAKSAYGLNLAKCRNVDIYDNQIITDYGRGIMMDGYENTAVRGVDYCNIYNNRIDVAYTNECVGGFYPENRVYGIRCRYASGNNSFTNNVVMVENRVPPGSNRWAWAFYIGSDSWSSGQYMENIEITGNTIIARKYGTNPNPQCINFDVCKSVNVADNRYQTDGTFITDSSQVTTLTQSNNTVFNPTATPSAAAPTGLRLTKFFNDYVLRWNDNPESDVLEYYVYKDGVRIPISSRGGTFYVDRNVTGTHTYSISALTLTGTEGPQCGPVSTTTAGNAWW